MSAKFSSACVEKMQLDVGKWVRHHQDVYLPKLPSGNRSINYATPFNLELLVNALTMQSAHTQESIDSVDRTVTRAQLQSDFDQWMDRLNGYLSYLTSLPPEELQNAAASYWCVTSPLLVGWWPNADCTAEDPEQRTRKIPDVATPLIIANQALCANGFFSTESFGTYWEYQAQLFKDVGGWLWENTEKLARKVKTHVEDYINFQKRALPWVAGAVMVGGLAYLAYAYGPKRRR